MATEHHISQGIHRPSCFKTATSVNVIVVVSRAGSADPEQLAEACAWGCGTLVLQDQKIGGLDFLRGCRGIEMLIIPGCYNIESLEPLSGSHLRELCIIGTPIKLCETDPTTLNSLEVLAIGVDQLDTLEGVELPNLVCLMTDSSTEDGAEVSSHPEVIRLER